jgi:hypothetical protein
VVIYGVRRGETTPSRKRSPETPVASKGGGPWGNHGFPHVSHVSSR